MSSNMKLDKHTVGTEITDSLYQLLVELRGETEEKAFAFYDRVVLVFIKAWEAGKVPRVYMGASSGKHRTFQVYKGTYERIVAISKADKISAAMVARTALAYNIYQKNKKDPWGSDIIGAETENRVSSAA